MTAMIVFLGDSITRDWPLNDVAGPAARNAGISGETTGQMRLRFEAAVLAARPRALHLLGGINDIAGNGGPVTPEEIVDNLAAMAEAARAREVAVVLGLLLPCARFRKHPRIDPRPAVHAVNAGLRAVAAARGLPLADYHAPLADGEDGLRADCTEDGLHPDRRGYAVMSPLARRALGALGPGVIDREPHGLR